MRKLLAIIVLGLMFSGNVSLAQSTKSSRVNDLTLAKLNNAKLFLLEIGMSKSEVLKIMGTENTRTTENPLKVDAFMSGEDNIMVLYYYTNHNYSGTFGRIKKNRGKGLYSTIYLSNTTPIIFLNGKLIGWGIESLERAKDQYNIKIKKDLNIKIE
jgi:hypothetical protein